MRLLTTLVGALALCGPARALAHEPAHDHEGCCCRHGQHPSHEPSARSDPEKPAQAKERQAPDQEAPKSAPEKAAAPSSK
jgi:hypothetical protein